MKLGAHVSVKGGVAKAFEWVDTFNCEAVQIFTKSQLQWASKPLTAEECAAYRAAWIDHGRPPSLVHNSYLINLCSPDEELWEKSVAAMVDEVERAAALAIPWVVTHPGSSRDAGEAFGVEACAVALEEILRRTKALPTGILLENTAGMGASLGGRFAQLGEILRAAGQPARLGVCLDTCHAFAAGYDFRTAAGYREVFAEFDATVGLRALHGFHLNDSKQPLGSHRDRHAVPGAGEIGVNGFRLLMQDVRFAELPGITELEDDLTPPALAFLKRLRDEP